MNQRRGYPGARAGAGSDKGRGRGGLAIAAGLAGSALRSAGRRPAVVLAGLAVIGGAGVFSWNATMKQTAQHPAPLFASAKPAPATPEAPRRAEPAAPLTTGATRADVPMPPARPSGPDAIGSIIRTSESPVKQAEAKPKPTEAKAKAADSKTGDAKKVADAKPSDAKAKSVEKPASTEAKPGAQPRVASAQKALSKLGYGPIAADGLLGSGTRQAIEKFEREKNLPVTGSLQPKTAKKLAALSGISIE